MPRPTWFATLSRFAFPLLVACVAAYLVNHPFTHLAHTGITKDSLKMSLSKKLSITDVELKGEKVLIRVDFNVP